MNSSIEFLNAIDGVWKTDIPAPVMARAKRSLLDYLAVTCAGAEFQKEKLTKYWEFAQPEAGAFRVIGTQKDVVLKEAVFLNGLNSGIIHLGSPIFPCCCPWPSGTAWAWKRC